MKIIYIGAGFVGACSSAVMAKFGHDVLVYDTNQERIKVFGSFNRDAIENDLFEQDLGSLIVQNKDRLSFTSDYQKIEDALDTVDAVFICVPTPVGENGSYNLNYYDSALNDLAQALMKRNNSNQEKYVVIVNKSTLPITMAEEADARLRGLGVKNFGIVSNPEFLVEGQAVRDSFSPDRTVIGATNEKDFAVMRQIYQRFYYAPGGSYIEVGPREAAAGKLLANYILFSRLVDTFDVVGRVGESFPGINFEKLRKIISSDKRIGSYGFYNNIYAGGSCLTKDSSSLAHQLEHAKSNAEQIKQTMAANLFQLDHFYKRLSDEANFDLQGKVVALLGAAFKRDTNDVRNSGAVYLAEKLLAGGVKELRIFDPVALDTLKNYWQDKHGDKVVYCKNESEALSHTEAGFILTDWPQFSTIDQIITQVCPPPYLIADGRRMISHTYDKLVATGYDILAVGSPFLEGKK